MMFLKGRSTVALLAGLTAFTTAAAAALTSLHITNNQTHVIPKTLYGWMWEDINHSGDGGLYAELLQNRAFQGVTPGTTAALAAWSSFNNASITVTSGITGVSTALPNSLQVVVPSGSSGTAGFQNGGYWGIKVQSGWNYTGSFYAKSDTFNGSVTASLVSSTGTILASTTVSGVTSGWKQHTFSLSPAQSAADSNNVFRITVDGSQAAGQTIYFGMFSLFPPTFKGRKNGMRIDLAEALAGIKPGVWRFPGGNNLEGETIASRWKWNETIGPIEDRPGRLGDWGYQNTDGLGLMEYFDWAEDIGAEPILGVWAGISLAKSGAVVAEADLQPYIDEVINELEFVTADSETNQWGALRAKYGRKEPYPLKYVEIGNEDFTQSASYAAYRWKDYFDQLSAKFPNLVFLATTYPSTALTPAYTWIDYHVYQAPVWFTNNAFMFDNYPRNGTQYFVGEYAVISTNTSNVWSSVGRLQYPTLQGSIAEAAFMTGMERNSDVVFASAYAPTLQHISGTQWTPDIITFDAGRFVKSTSYYVQELFALNLGTHVLSTNPVSASTYAPLYWVASYNEDTSVVVLKVANAGSSSQTVAISLDHTVSSGSASILSYSGSVATYNTLDAPNTIVPVTSTVSLSSPTSLSYTFPANSVVVITLKA